MTGPKTNERPGTRAVVRNVRMSATKVRVVLDLIRGLPLDEARAVLAYTERSAAEVVGKCLESAAANAEHNDQIDPETLYVTACFADEGRTMYRWRPRARGRATRIRKRTCHVTIILAAMPADMLAVEQAKREAIPGSRAARRRGQEQARRAERVAASQAADEGDEASAGEIVDATEDAITEDIDGDVEVEAAEVEQTDATEAVEDAGVVDTTVEATSDDGEQADQADEEQK